MRRPPVRLTVVLSLALSLLGVCSGRSQEHGLFQFTMELNYAAAERTIELYRGVAGNPREIAQMRGNRLALATTSLLSSRRLTLEDLQRALEGAKYNQGLGDDPFRIGNARTEAQALNELCQELRRRNFGQKVASTVEQLFPAGAQVRGTLPIYFVAFGHQNIDAFVRRVSWNGDEPVFVREGEGTETIVVNLAKAVGYGRSTEERFVRLLQTVAHEVFHAAFGAYKDASPVWREYYATRNSAGDALFDLTHNEGIAYYLSLVQANRGRLPADWQQRVSAAFDAYNRAGEELLDPRTSPRRVQDILRSSNTSGYWESFASMTGMVMAKHIDQALGRQALAETIARGPEDFFRKYADVARRDPEVPRLSTRLLQAALQVPR